LLSFWKAGTGDYGGRC